MLHVFTMFHAKLDIKCSPSLFLQVYNRKVTYVCAEGFYSPAGDHVTIECADGDYPDPSSAFVCLKPCGSPPEAVNGAIVSSDAVEVHYSCNSGFEAISGGYVYCNGGTGLWSSGYGIVCRMPCVNDDIPDGVNAYVMEIIVKSEFSLRAVYTCLPSFHPALNYTEPYVNNCTDGNFTSAKGLVCEADCGAPPSPSGATIVKWNQYQAEFDCATGYMLTSRNRLLLCQDRAWVGELPICRKTCPASPPAGVNSITKVSGPAYERTVEYRCANGTHPIRESTTPLIVKCSNGEYDTEAGLECELDCPDTVYGQPVECSRNAYSASCVCHKGYVNVGGDSLVCSNGVWVGDVPNCLRECQVIPDVPHSTLIATGPSYDLTLTYTCHPGSVYQLITE